MRIGIDAMGSDNAPAEEIAGALAAREFLEADDKIVLVGKKETLLEQLKDHDGWQDFIEIRNADQAIGMAEAPVEALRTKPNSSLVILFDMHKAGELDGCISAGNTGACVAAAQMRLRRLAGVHRPGIAILTPTAKGPVAVCDVGANVNCRPQHLYQYGVMSSVYVNVIGKVEKPRVGLLSIGQEAAKGNELVKATRELMKDDPNLIFVGNVESRDLFSGVCDVLVCDGFVGNVVLKLMEGMATSVLKAIISEMVTVMPDQMVPLKKAAGSIVSKYDFNEYGGAPLLGVNGICVICHGASNFHGIKNAIHVTLDLAKHHVNKTIVNLLSQHQGTVHG